MNKRKCCYILIVVLGACILLFMGFRLFYVSKDYRTSETYDENIAQYLIQNDFSGTVLIAKDNKIIYSKGYGYANADTGMLNTRDTRFEIDSLTKQFTACAVLRLCGQGLMHMDDTLDQYYPDCSYGSEVTIRDLIQMQSGIPEYMGNEYVWGQNFEGILFAGISVEKLLNQLLALPLNFEPGSQYEYSNSNYYILGPVIEKVSGKTYAAYIEEEFLKPCGISKPSFLSEGVEALGIAENGEVSDKAYHHTVTYAAGCMALSAVDLYKWQNALYNGRIADVNIQEQFADGQEYACGLHYNGKVFSHSGEGYICHSTMIYAPQERVQIIVLSNGFECDTEEITQQLYEWTLDYIS